MLILFKLIKLDYLYLSLGIFLDNLISNIYVYFILFNKIGDIGCYFFVLVLFKLKKLSNLLLEFLIT